MVVEFTLDTIYILRYIISRTLSLFTVVHDVFNGISLDQGSAEFDIEIRDKKGTENSVANHLSRVERESDPIPNRDEFPDEQLMQVNKTTPWFVDICNFIVASQFPPKASRLYKEKLKSDAKYYIWDDPYLWRLCNNQHLEAATMVQLEQPKKCSIAGSTSTPFSETLINSSPLVNNVKE
ncbi:hypothetical protein CR513_44174, partial [Mucuna pruriens]